MRTFSIVLTILSLLGGTTAFFTGSAVAAAAATSLVPTRFLAPPTYSLSTARPDKPGAWNFFAAAAGETNVANYTPLALRVDSTPNVVLSPTFPQVTLPCLFWPAKEGGGEADDEMTVRPESDKNTAGKKGDIIVMWTVPAKDFYLVKIQVDNVGLDVKGGDGGLLSVSKLGAKENDDTRVIDRVGVPPSFVPMPQAQGYMVVDAEAGDRIVLRLNAGADGYADQWKLRYAIARTGPEGFLAQPPVVAAAPAAPLRPGTFFLGTGADWSNGPFAIESLQLIQRFVPNLGVIMVSHQPERVVQLPFYHANNIPTLIQTWGPTYEPYLHIKNAFEVTWKGEDLGKPGALLAGTTHAAALPHPATREAFERVVRSSVRSGFSGFGFQDMVWMWGAGAGAGHNPATIDAFRQDLQGLDKGLQLTPLSGQAIVFKFADYAHYYFGGMPSPGAFGLSSWEQYQPITLEQYSKKLKTDTTPDFLLFDLLVHYEWLKMVDFLGHTARSENGTFQVMPNPENVTNGADSLFASQLSNVGMFTEEYFIGPEFLDGAYYHNAYYGHMAAKNRASLGVVMESGGGGNDMPYYDNEVAYATALDLTLATQADHLEADFWPGNGAPLSENVKNPGLMSRYQQVLSYGLGFTDAKKDGLRRPAPDFVSITSRRIFRPWDAGWNRWPWTTHFRLSPENTLVQSGFNFLGIGEEGLGSLTTPQKAVLFTGDPPTEYGWQQFTQMISSGRIERGITIAGALQEVITKSFERQPFVSHFPQINFQVRDVAPSGELALRGTRVSTGNFAVVGAIYTDKVPGSTVVMTLGGEPVVVQRSLGKGNLYVLLFDPSLRDNEALTTIVYGTLLRQAGITRSLQINQGCVARLYQNGDLTAVGVDSVKLRAPSPSGPDYITKRAWPYKMDATLDVKVRLKPGLIYDWVALPSGAKGQSTAAQDGFIPLQHSGTSCEVFYVLPHSANNEAKLKTIRARKDTFLQAMTLDRKVPTP